MFRYFHFLRPAPALACFAAPALILASALGAHAAASAATPVPRGQPATVRVTIQGYTFKPKTITIAPGTRVVWTNKDSDIHTVYSDTDVFTQSNDLPTGKTFTHTFAKTGTYRYHCGQHAFMTGTVIVKSLKR